MIIETNRQFASQALRVLAFAYKPLASGEDVDKADENDLIFLGLQGMINHMVKTLDFPVFTVDDIDPGKLNPENKTYVARALSIVELLKAGKAKKKRNWLKLKKHSSRKEQLKIHR